MKIPEILTNYGIEFRLGGQHKNVRQGWIGIECMHCGDGSGKFHLGISLTGRPHASCWRCGTLRMAEVFDSLGIPKSLLGAIPATDVGIAQRPRGKLKVPAGVQELGGQHRQYLLDRGFDPDELAQLWDLQGIGIAAWLPWSIWIPVIYEGEVVSWTSRSISDQVSAKYISASPEEESMPIKSVLYGWDYVRMSVIVVEGPADVWKIGPGAVATFGVNVSDEQIRLLSSVPYRMICFDNDEAGQRRADELAERLSYTSGETSICRLDSKDAGEATTDEIDNLRRWLDGIEIDTTDGRTVGSH